MPVNLDLELFTKEQEDELLHFLEANNKKTKIKKNTNSIENSCIDSLPIRAKKKNTFIEFDSVTLHQSLFKSSVKKGIEKYYIFLESIGESIAKIKRVLSLTIDRTKPKGERVKIENNLMVVKRYKINNKKVAKEIRQECEATREIRSALDIVERKSIPTMNFGSKKAVFIDSSYHITNNPKKCDKGYFFTPFIPGKSLQYFLNSIDSKYDEDVILINAILDYIEKFYRVGYLHKDIKPDNIHFDEINKKIYFLDFGLSKKIVTHDEIEREFYRLEDYLLKPLKERVGNIIYDQQITRLRNAKDWFKISNSIQKRIFQLKNERNIFLVNPKEKITLLNLLLQQIVNETKKDPREIIKEFECRYDIKNNQIHKQTNGEIMRSTRNIFSFFMCKKTKSITSDLLDFISSNNI